jgi:hypothetical protein
MPMQAKNGIDLNNQRGINVASPSSPTDIANMAYVDGKAAGLSWKQDVAAATTANGTLATAFAAGQVVDNVTLTAGMRLLVKNQTTQTQNGIYIVQSAGAPVLAPDANTSASLNNATLSVIAGTLNAGTSWTQTTPNPTIGTSNIVWGAFNAGQVYTGTAPIVVTGSVISFSGTLLAKYAATLTAGNASYTVTHNLGTADLSVSILDLVTLQYEFPDVFQVTGQTTTQLTVTYGSATTNNKRIVVMG